MSKERYQWYMGTSEIIDNKTKKFITQDCPELLNKQSKQIVDLEAKLAEKDKEITQRLVIQEKDYNQDKISFALEQLEKVKEHISSGLAFDIDVQMWFEEYIDNQIKMIKGE